MLWHKREVSEETDFRFWYGYSLYLSIHSPGCIRSQKFSVWINANNLCNSKHAKTFDSIRFFVSSPHHIPHSFPVHSILMQTIKKKPFSFNYFLRHRIQNVHFRRLYLYNNTESDDVNLSTLHHGVYFDFPRVQCAMTYTDNVCSLDVHRSS